MDNHSSKKKHLLHGGAFITRLLSRSRQIAPADIWAGHVPYAA
jgi:hypothetical protein